MKRIILVAILMGLNWTIARSQSTPEEQDLFSYARSRKSDLQLSCYATAHCINEMFTTPEGRREVLSVLKCNGITKVYLEVCRAGLVLPVSLLSNSINLLKANGFEVAGGIATLPGDNFAKKQEGPLTWCNWQNKKTQDDLREVMKTVAPLFDTFVVDDFLCTSDTSLESKSAKGSQSWSVYRRALLSELQEKVLIQPAKAANPNIKIIIKYPQWYDRFHLFGYDVVTGPELFDQVWAGTETRGQYTQRYGYVQPYEGFINYRWIATLSGKKIGGAWFDYGDCTSEDFIEQAYQSVLAGAKELILFSMYDLLLGHAGNHPLRQKFEELADLSRHISRNGVTGPVAYKPAHSDAGSDLYLMDGIGMLGISLVPASDYPDKEKVLFLPTQAASDKDILAKIKTSLKSGAKLILTTGYLIQSPDGAEIAGMAGVKWPVTSLPFEAEGVLVNEKVLTLKTPLKLEAPLLPAGASVILKVKKGSEQVPFLTRNQQGNIWVMNVHTFSEADFAAVGEVLLSPRPLGLYDIPVEWANIVRTAFQIPGTPVLDAPARVAFQMLTDGSVVLQNYNQEASRIKINLNSGARWKDLFSGKAYTANGNVLELMMPARSRVWLVKER